MQSISPHVRLQCTRCFESATIVHNEKLVSALASWLLQALHVMCLLLSGPRGRLSRHHLIAVSLAWVQALPVSSDLF